MAIYCINSLIYFNDILKQLHGYCMICSFALDTAAILGGDEYLIQQILEELQRLQYNKNEKNVLRWALTEVRINFY